jgi:hypothetical protein
MKNIAALTIGVFTVLATSAWCQSQPQPSGPGETLRRSQDTMEYYQLQRKLHKGQKRLDEKAEDANENTGNQKEIEIINEENGVIRFFEEPEPDQQK